jgi:hypothetical protein
MSQELPEYQENPEWKESVDACEQIVQSAAEQNIFIRMHPTSEAFVERMMDSYPEEVRGSTRLWHVLLSSSPSSGGVSELDFPGGEIEKFIKEVVPTLQYKDEER